MSVLHVTCDMSVLHVLMSCVYCMSMLHVLPVSVLDVFIHKAAVRASRIRLDKLKESENDAVVSVYSNYVLDPFHDE